MSKELNNKSYQEEANLNKIYNVFVQILLRITSEEENE